MQQAPPSGLPMRYRHRRRAPLVNTTGPMVADRGSAPPAPELMVTARRAISALLPLFAVALLLHSFLNLSRSQTKTREINIRLPISDDELAVARFRVPIPTDPAPAKGLITCMPTVTRGNGSVEYVSNAAKSWWLAHAGNPPPLRVYEMDAGPEGPTAPSWLSSVGSRGPPETGWLRTRRLTAQARSPRRLTHGDSAERVAWRSKEAQDYASVLRHCVAAAALAGDSEVLVVQDDVLFTPAFPKATEWARGVLVDGARTRVNAQGVRRPERVCSASLFDITGKGTEKLTSSNLVARVWRIEEALRVADYVENRFDHAPVDWLTDHWCRKHHGIVAVLRPNPVRHRGQVSSFSGNEREGTLT